MATIFLAATGAVNPFVGYTLEFCAFVNLGVLIYQLINGKANVQRFWMYAAACSLVSGLIDIANSDWTSMWVDAAFMAYDLIMWWFAGGGNDTKRRLRKLKEKFEGKRRTAPVTV